MNDRQDVAKILLIMFDKATLRPFFVVKPAFKIATRKIDKFLRVLLQKSLMFAELPLGISMRMGMKEPSSS